MTQGRVPPPISRCADGIPLDLSELSDRIEDTKQWAKRMNRTTAVTFLIVVAVLVGIWMVIW